VKYAIRIPANDSPDAVWRPDSLPREAPQAKLLITNALLLTMVPGQEKPFTGYIIHFPAALYVVVRGTKRAWCAASRWLGGDLIDHANADAELQIRLHETDSQLLRAIEEALVRIRQGTFGVCQVCNQPISKARLEAVPWTRLCLECKEGGRSTA
jgi:RNA polymerase-binding protein DksA